MKAVEWAVRFYEQLPAKGLVVETPWSDIWLSAAEWAEAFDSAEPTTPHNEAPEQVWEALLEILIDQFDDEEVPPQLLRPALLQNEELTSTFAKAWPLLDPLGVVGDLWAVSAYLRMCAPWLAPDDIQLLQRAEPRSWTVSDLPLLDAAHQRVGDPEASRMKRRREATLAAEREQMNQIIDNLIEADDSELRLMSMLRGQDAQNSLVDEAQELTDAEWQMLLLRCPSRSFTIVGDRAQARHGFTETWRERLKRIGIDHVTMASLSINYRTPEEVMAEAEPVIRAALPDANVPTSIRSSGIPVAHGAVSDLGAILETWLAEHSEGEGIEGAVDRYVAMTRATQRLVILTSR